MPVIGRHDTPLPVYHAASCPLCKGSDSPPPHAHGATTRARPGYTWSPYQQSLGGVL
jgi:hypothetical protein